MGQPDSVSERAINIASQLGEFDPIPVSQIKRMLVRLGEDQVQALVDEAVSVYKDGGLTIGNSDQKRTLGGIFFKIAKDKVKSADRYFIWLRGQKKKDVAPPFRWADRLQLQATLAQTLGEVTIVKVTLVGRPGKIVAKGDVIITSMSSSKAPSLSKQLPKVPDTVTNYVVFIAKKQWAKVAESLKDPEDKLVVEGYPIIDSKMRGITVFAQNTTTKLLQQQQKQ